MNRKSETTRPRWALAATALATALVCALPAEAAEVLKFWTFLATQGTDPRSTALREVVDGFNKSQSKWEVQVESINFARIDNVVIQSTAAGQGPDILNVYSDQLAMHVAAKTVKPLDALLGPDWTKEAKDFAVSPEFFRFGGAQMAIPWEARVWLLWYRKDLLDAAGFGVPKTVDELKAAGAKITTDAAMGFGFGASTAALGAGAVEAFIPLYWGAGGKLFDASGKTLIAGEAGVKTLTLMRDLVAAGAMKKTVASMSVEDALTSVKAGTLSMTLMGSFRVGAARASATTEKTLLTAPVPGWTKDAPSPARIAGQTLTIGANSKHADGALAFIRWYTSPASQVAFAKAGVMPSRLATYESDEMKKLGNYAELRGWADYLHAHGRMEATPADFPKLSAAIATAMQRVIVQGADPKAALDEAAAAYNDQRG
jgi:multiple sugar transport system substrate-binding protein